MAVNSITFGNINSADYGIYISGEGVFDAPKRAVEMVNVPGRSGAIALDQGYYENITVTYPAHNYEPDMADFKQALSDFRNALASQVGYQRLSDTFHPDEYRMAVFDEGLDINPIKYNTASQFDIKFDCKPQRYLTSGETEITVESGDTLTNPTQYASSPLLMVEGYGTIGFNGYEVELENAVLGTVSVAPRRSFTTKDGSSALDVSLLNSGDSINASGLQLSFSITFIVPETMVSDITVTNITNSDASFTASKNKMSAVRTDITVNCPPFSLTKGTTETLTNTATVTGTAMYSATPGSISPTTVNFSITCSISISADQDSISVSRSYANNQSTVVAVGTQTVTSYINEVTGYSTTSLLGNPTYIDCDLGECYKIESGEYVSLNGKIALGSDLPELASGENEITFDNTITELKIIPRWWKL